MKKTKRLFLCIVAMIASLMLLAGCSNMEEGESRPVVKLISIDSAWAKNSVNGVIFRRDPLASDSRWQYVSYYDSEGRVVVGKRRRGKSSWELERTEIKGGAEDAHNTISMAVDGEGVLHVALGCHCSPLQYYVSERPGSLNLREAKMVGSEEAEATYPEFYRLSSGDLLFTYRDGRTDRVALVINRYDCKRKEWERVRSAVIESHGDLTPYWQMCVDVWDRVHLTWSWRGARDVESNHDICYAYSEDGGRSWSKNDGTLYELPVTYESADVIAKVGPSATLINQGTMACGKKGEVYLATYYRGVEDSVVQYHVLCRKEGKWDDHCVSQRRVDFRLDGAGGTRGIPISRPLIAVRGDVCYVFCRDIEDDMRIGVYYGRLGQRQLRKKVFSDMFVGYWEPTFDSWLWHRYGELNLYVQRMAQEEGRSGENLEELEPQPNYVMEVTLP